MVARWHAHRLPRPPRVENSVEVVDAAGRNRTTLWTSDRARDPYCAEHDDFAWSPDGQTMIFAAHEACPGQPDLFVVPADGSAQAGRLLAPGMNGVFPRFSPTAGRSPSSAVKGRHQRHVRGRHRIRWRWCWRPPGPSDWSTLEGSPAEQWFSPRWSPDGTELAVAIGFEDGPISSWRPTVRGTRPGNRPGIQPELVAGRQAHRVSPEGG